MKNLFEEATSRTDLPAYQLHLVSDGHGVNGHVISTFIIEKYPQILSKCLISALKEIEDLESRGQEITPHFVVGESVIEERDDEDM